MTITKLKEFTRELPFEQNDDSHSDGLTFSGYAAVFNQPTRISSMWEGEFDEEIHRGAFVDSLRDTTPVFQFDHGRSNAIGSIPVGTITRAEEDEKGLYVEARMLDNWLVQPVRDAIKAGAIKGMSFRFSVPDGGETWTETKGAVAKRDLTRLDVPELGPVVFPAYQGTSASIRSRLMELVGMGEEKDLQAVGDSITRSDKRDDASEIEKEMIRARLRRDRQLRMLGIL